VPFVFGRKAEWLGLARSLRDHSVYRPRKSKMTAGEERKYKKTSSKIFIMIILPLFLIGSLYFVSKPNLLINNDAEDVNLLEEQESVFKEMAKPVFGDPKRIVIDSVGIDIPVVPVGVDTAGFLETPEKWNEAGWYEKSAKVAEPGNLIIDAHYDDNLGRPAAFWKLKNVNVGDKVSVLDSYGRIYNYKISNIYYVGINDPDRSKVFENYKGDNSPIVTLITCGGIWSTEKSTYDKRLVVSAELISDTFSGGDSAEVEIIEKLAAD